MLSIIQLRKNQVTPSPVHGNQNSSATCRTSLYGLGNGSSLLPVLVSRLTLLKSLVLWDCIFGQLFQVS